MKHRLAFVAGLILTGMVLTMPVQAAKAHSGKAAAGQKELLVVMPLRVSEDDRELAGAMEAALVEGLESRYKVFSGEQVQQKAREIFRRESTTAKHDCDETRCMQDIAQAFQAELIATANVAKRSDGYFLALSIRNIFDDTVVFSASTPCKNCDAYQVIDRLKQLSGSNRPEAAQSAAEPDIASSAASDPETALWEEVKKGNAAEDYQAYLSQYPKGKYVALAKSRLTRLQEEIRAEADKQERQSWQTAQETNTEQSYQGYLESYPAGQYTALAKARIGKLQKDATQSSRPGKTFRDCNECAEMVVIPAGSFDMGSPSGEAGRQNDEGPVHRVSVKSFALGRTEITKGQFAAFVQASGYDAGNKCYVLANEKWSEQEGANWKNPGYAQGDDHPAVCINWNDAKAYAEWMSRKTGKSYRLPTEAEWEYAARAGSASSRYWGEDADQACGYANVGDQTLKNQVSGWQYPTHNCTDGYAYTAPVGHYKPNAFGLYDMIGNVWEWVQDSYHENYNGAPTDGTEWAGDGAGRVLRGGSWNVEPQYARASVRSGDGPAGRGDGSGLRLARTLP